MFAMGVTAAFGVGPAVGGAIIQDFEWRLIFLAPIPFTALAATLAYFFLPAAPRVATPPRMFSMTTSHSAASRCSTATASG